MNGERQPLVAGRSVNVYGFEGADTGRANETARENEKACDVLCTKGNVYIKANQIIRESRPYVPGKKLNCYVYVYFMRLVYLLYLVVVIPSPFLPPRIAWPWSIATLLLGLPWFILFCQHLHVVCLTVPWVLSQPIVPDYQQSVSTRIWAVEELEMEKMYKRDRGVGLVDRNTGLVQFNRLNRTAEITMYKTVLQSCFMFLFAVLALSLSAGVLWWKYQLAAYPQLTGTANTTYFDSFGST